MVFSFRFKSVFSRYQLPAILLLAGLILCFSCPHLANAQDDGENKKLRVFRDRYVVEMNDDAPQGGVSTLAARDHSKKLARAGARIVRGLGRGNGGEMQLVKPLAVAAQAGISSIDGQEEVVDYNKENDYCAELIKSGAVKSCSPDFEITVAAVPNDPSYPSLWGMNSDRGIDAPSAWDLATGSSQIVVAVVDTGVDYNHPDLAANMWVNPGEIPGNGIDDDGNGYVDDVYGWNAFSGNGNPMDDNGHGTHCAGTIGAVGNNGRGVAGVNWNVKIMALKFLGAGGNGGLSGAIQALNYMVTMKKRGVNIRVSNNSWGGGGFSQGLYNVIKEARDQGIIFAAAAGNEARNNDVSPAFPSSYDLSNVVSVAALDQNRNLASFSNYGAEQVDIAAPGVGILSTYPGGNYASLSGTSMATPHVAGALALLLSREPGLSAQQAIERMYLTGLNLVTLNSLVKTGRMLNAGRMIRNITSPLPAPTPLPAPCQYSAESIAYAPDTSVDQSPVLLQADEYNFQTVDLPFSFPFFNEQISRLVISPNGIVYTKTQPNGMDYQNSSSAPLNSIAALHGDLTTANSPHGVRIKMDAEKVTVYWLAESYTKRGQGSILVHLTIHKSGVIEDYVSFTNQDLLTLFRSGSTIGMTGSYESNSTTWAHNSNKLVNNLALRFTPHCSANPDPSGQSSVKKVKLNGLSKAGRLTPNIQPGKKIRIGLEGTGAKPVEVRAYFNNKACKESVIVPFNNGAVMTGSMPKVNNRFSKLKVRAGAAAKAAQIKHLRARSKARSVRSKRVNAKTLSKYCVGLYQSLR